MRGMRRGIVLRRRILGRWSVDGLVRITLSVWAEGMGWKWSASWTCAYRTFWVGCLASLHIDIMTTKFFLSAIWLGLRTLIPRPQKVSTPRVLHYRSC